MQYEEFIQHVQAYAELDTPEEALQLTEAVLSTLGERIYRTEQSQMAAQLPRGIKELLVARQPPENTRNYVQGFTVEEFYNRVGARTNVRYQRAVAQTKAVMAVLQESVSAGQIDDVKGELPAEFAELFERSA